MPKAPQSDAIRTFVTYGALGFGAVAFAAPKVFAGIYGLKGDGNLTTMIRLWGTRTAAIGALSLLASDDGARRNIVTVGTAMSAADALAIATAGSDVAARSRIMGVATSAVFVAAGALQLSGD